MAAAYIKMGQQVYPNVSCFHEADDESSFQEAVELADTALTYDSSFVKARYRRAVARKGLGFLDASIIGDVTVLSCKQLPRYLTLITIRF
jgi:hypothetical protein